MKKLLAIIISISIFVTFVPLITVVAIEPNWIDSASSIMPNGNMYSITNENELAWVAKEEPATNAE